MQLWQEAVTLQEEGLRQAHLLLLHKQAHDKKALQNHCMCTQIELD